MMYVICYILGLLSMYIYVWYRRKKDLERIEVVFAAFSEGVLSEMEDDSNESGQIN